MWIMIGSFYILGLLVAGDAHSSGAAPASDLTRIGRFEALSQGLARCQINMGESSELKDRILESARGMPNGCAQPAMESLPLTRDRLPATDIAASILNTDLENSTYDHALVNAVNNYLEIGAGTTDDFCRVMSPKFGCTANERKLLSENGNQSRAIDPQSATSIINQAIGRLNELPMDPKDPERIETLRSLTHAPTSLLFTGTLEAKAGDVLGAKRLQPIHVEDFLEAREEAAKMILNRVRSLQALQARAISPKKQNEFIEGLIENDPVAVGQALFEHPEYASLLCGWLQKIQEKRGRTARVQKRFELGTGAGALGLDAGAGALLLFSGAGTPAGALLIAGALTGLVSGGHDGLQAFDYYRQGKARRAALISGSGDVDNAAESKGLAYDAYWAGADSFMQIAFSLADMGALRTLARVGKLDAACDFVRSTVVESKYAKMAADAKSAVGSRMSSVLEASWNATKGSFSKYWSEFLERPIWRYPIRNRIFFVTRDVTRGAEARRQVGDWFWHPVATAFNRPLQASKVGLAFTPSMYLFNRVFDYVPERRDRAVIEKAVKMKDKVPGGDFTWDVMAQGEMSGIDWANQLVDHDVALAKWMRSKDPALYLPRIADFTQEGLLNPEEVSYFNVLAKKSFAQAFKETREHREALGNVAGQSLEQALQRDPHFKQRPESEIEILSSVYWPMVRIGRSHYWPKAPMGKSHSDIELNRRLMEDLSPENPGKGDTFERDVMKQLYLLIAQEEARVNAAAPGQKVELAVTLAKIYKMEAGYLDDPAGTRKAIEAKRSRARAILPPERQDMADRPDLPDLENKETMKGDANHETIFLRDEMDRWNLLLNDSRFQDIALYWRTGQYTDGMALESTEDRIKEIDHPISSLKPAGKPNPRIESPVSVRQGSD